MNTESQQNRDAGPETVAGPESDPMPAASREIDIKRLRRNYTGLLRSREIYYPLAYRFTRELGRGRQGVVFQALRQGARGCTTQHAIKLHDPSIYPSTEKYWTDMGRIASQISKLQKVNSPNLVSRDIYEEIDGIGYTQMEVVEGIDTHHLVHGNHFEAARARSTPEEWEHFTDAVFNVKDEIKRIQPGVAMFIMRQVLRGLEELHNAGFLHSDIKPANIMIDRLGIIKIIDYGRAVTVDEKHTFLMGTPLFMAPEVHCGESAMIQSDLYSVGLVGLELLRGRPLVDTETLNEDELLRFKMRLPELLPEILPTRVRRNDYIIGMLRRMLHPDPKQRYADAMEAESGPEGLVLVHKQLAQAGKDTEYDRELEFYIEKLLGRRNEPRREMDEILA
ncbi:serine/threonine protein kinase [Kiritimatiella glycovorans]|uniref:Serine/threonine-protein kinase StkP n=1 Tax=Kiritimatiella glycovorans TaxID=1307763 RepID=A0A0G3EB27_9BACT|nr:serine/threonine-protein kinase [Kiritimatiella glycovorans]AKJ63493.1 Serine/threonine-protein kinase StkP [Kiritimatiella glycovorans]